MRLVFLLGLFFEKPEKIQLSFFGVLKDCGSKSLLPANLNQVGFKSALRAVFDLKNHQIQKIKQKSQNTRITLLLKLPSLHYPLT